MLIFLFVQGISIQSLHAKKVDGYIVRSVGDTLRVFVHLRTNKWATAINFAAMQSKVAYSKAKGKQATKFELKPTDALEYGFYFDSVLIRMKATPPIKNAKTTGQLFLHLLVDGPVRLYQYYYSMLSWQNTSYTYTSPTFGTTGVGSNGTATNYVYTGPTSSIQDGNRYLLQQNDEPLSTLYRRIRKKEISPFFEACPNLLKDLMAHYRWRKEFPQLVLQYNKNCP